MSYVTKGKSIMVLLIVRIDRIEGIAKPLVGLLTLLHLPRLVWLPGVLGFLALLCHLPNHAYYPYNHSAPVVVPIEVCKNSIIISKNPHTPPQRLPRTPKPTHHYAPTPAPLPLTRTRTRTNAKNATRSEVPRCSRDHQPYRECAVANLKFYCHTL